MEVALLLDEQRMTELPGARALKQEHGRRFVKLVIGMQAGDRELVDDDNGDNDDNQDDNSDDDGDNFGCGSGGGNNDDDDGGDDNDHRDENERNDTSVVSGRGATASERLRRWGSEGYR